MKNRTDRVTGRTAAAVVLKSAEQEKAALTRITAGCRRKYTKKRLFYSGSVVFDKKTIKHIEKDILPIVDKIARLTGTSPKLRAYEISIVNPSVASVMDKGLEISGFSADVPVFLALLSAELNIPLAQDFVAAGHIASADGDIRPVNSLSSKINAAVMTDGIQRFILPQVDSDISRKNWQQPELEQQADIIPCVQRDIDIIQVSHICQVLPAVFSKRDAVIASLENNYFGVSDAIKDEKGDFGRILAFLAGESDTHFWKILGSDANAGDIDNVKKLILARVKHQIREKIYPEGFGRRLLQLVLAVPGFIRRSCFTGELIDMRLYFQLCRFADKDQLIQDSRYLRDVLEGRTADSSGRWLTGVSGIEKRNPGTADLETVFSQISEEQLSQKISQPLDQAKADYILERITVDCAEQFFEQIRSFYIHLISRTSLAPARIDSQMLESAALQLLERAFSGSGGLDTALNEAMNGYNGGMNLILNQMTEQLKFEQKTGYINSVLSRVVDQSDYDQRVEFTAELMKYLRHWLPSDMKNRPASTLVDRYQEIIKAYVNSLEKLKQTFRRF